MNGRPWTEDEKRFIAEHLDWSVEDIAKHLDRTPGSVQSKRRLWHPTRTPRSAFIAIGDPIMWIDNRYETGRAHVIAHDPSMTERQKFHNVATLCGKHVLNGRPIENRIYRTGGYSRTVKPIVSPQVQPGRRACDQCAARLEVDPRRWPRGESGAGTCARDRCNVVAVPGSKFCRFHSGPVALIEAEERKTEALIELEQRKAQLVVSAFRSVLDELGVTGKDRDAVLRSFLRGLPEKSQKLRNGNQDSMSESE